MREEIKSNLRPSKRRRPFFSRAPPKAHWRRHLLLKSMILFIQSILLEGSSSNTGGKHATTPPPFALAPDTLAGPPRPPQPSFWALEDDDDDSSSGGEERADNLDGSDSDSDPGGWMSFGGTRSSVHKAQPANAILAPSKPLETLEKLQQMLDETDYMTSRQRQQQQHQHQQQQQLQQFQYEEPVVQQDLNDLSNPPPLPDIVGAADPYPVVDNTYFKEQAGHYPFNEPLPHNLQQQQQQQQVESKTNNNQVANQYPLWTSKDRKKYKQQQKRHLHPPTSKPDESEQSDTEDGVEYTLPNLPVYLSDTEGESDEGEEYIAHGHMRGENPPPHLPPPRPQQVLRPDPATGYPPFPPPPPLPPHQYSIPAYSQEAYPQVPYDYQGAIAPPLNTRYGNPYSYPPPYNNDAPGNPNLQQQQYYAAQQHYAAYAAAMGYAPSPRNGPAPPQAFTQLPPTNTKTNKLKKTNIVDHHGPQELAPPHVPSLSLQHQHQQQQQQQQPSATSQYDVTIATQQQCRSLAEAFSRVNFDSVQKLSLMLFTAAMACYASVSPRTLPQIEYNRLFYNNIRILALTMIAPFIYFFSVFDVAHNDLNHVIHSLYTSFTLGYILCFGLEIFWTTLVRLSVFLCFEPEIFDLVPKIPVVVLPWVLRDIKYRPQRITVMMADVLTSCVACPLVEEYVKLKILQWTTRLPKTYHWARTKTKSLKNSSSGGGSGSNNDRKKNSKWKREKIAPRPGEKEITNVNKYVVQMLAVSIGLKLADTGRRVLTYTKPQHADKSFYAICRGIFPIQELCGTMTALRLAKRDVLGANMSMLWVLAPAVIVHGMANLRGKKGIFKWNSATPWSEMQLSPLSSTDASTLPELASKGFSKFMWLIILLRVLGYCTKNYYYTNRQAEKRTTTYAGNPSAIDAALASSDLLKKTKTN